MLCPIVRKEISDEDCTAVTEQSYLSDKTKKALMPTKFKRILGWKTICKECKFHKSVSHR